MKFAYLLALVATGALLAGCTPQAPAVVAAAPDPTLTDTGCANPETGAITPQSPGLPDVRLAGPFVVKSLMVTVDPANPNTFGSVLWSKTGSWIPITEFRGPFYLASGETLSAEMNKSPYVTVFYGCRLD